MKTKKERRYLIGFKSDPATAYGKEHYNASGYVKPLTLRQAKSALDSLYSEKAVKVIYKLVPVLTWIPPKHKL